MAIPVISLRDMNSVKRKAKSIAAQYPGSPRSFLLDKAAQELYGARHYRELRAWRKATVNSYVTKIGNDAECAYCGLSFVSNIGGDVRAHQARHDRYEEAITALGYHPQGYRQQEASKSEGYLGMSEKNPLEQQIEGALKVLRAWFDRSLESAIDKGYWKDHPSFEAYISYSIPHPKSFSKNVEEVLVRRFGAVPGVMEPGMSYWYPPRRKHQVK